MAIIGIDLGTTNSLAAVWQNGKSVLIPNAAGEYLTPSVVSVDEDGSILVGRAARDRLISHPERTASAFKRDMGTRRRVTLGKKSFLPEELSSFILRSLREDAEIFLGERVTEAVVSVPAYFAEGQRAATKRAAALAGLKAERLINEPSAAAVAGRIAEGKSDKLCLVYDFGGGTLDVSLVERFENVVSVTAVSGDNHLGGRDFDEAIARAFCRECGIAYGTLSARQHEMLLRQAEICKIALSTQDPVIMAVDDGQISASLLLSNSWIVRKCGMLFRRMTLPLRRVFSDAGISSRELDELIMVGGSSRMPVVRQYVSRFLKREPVRDRHPDTTVALGTGICAGLKAHSGELKELILTDVCPFTLGIDVLNRNEPSRPLMSPIIERNSVLPTSKMGVYHTSRDNQDRVEVRIYQGENRYCADNVYLGKLSLEVPPAPKGEQSVRVRFTYDINGLLEAEAETDDGKRVRLVLHGEMSKEEAAERLAELRELKLHPREQEENRALIARGERLYAMTVGHLRGRVAEMLDWFQRQLSGQEPLRIARAQRRVCIFFDHVEEYLSDGAEGMFDAAEDDSGWMDSWTEEDLADLEGISGEEDEDKDDDEDYDSLYGADDDEDDEENDDDDDDESGDEFTGMESDDDDDDEDGQPSGRREPDDDDEDDEEELDRLMRDMDKNGTDFWDTDGEDQPHGATLHRESDGEPLDSTEPHSEHSDSTKPHGEPFDSGTEPHDEPFDGGGTTSGMELISLAWDEMDSDSGQTDSDSGQSETDGTDSAGKNTSGENGQNLTDDDKGESGNGTAEPSDSPEDTP